MKKIYIGANGVAKKVKKAYLGAKDSIEYTILEYIESSGIQYIDTDFVPDGNTKMTLTGKFVSGEGKISCIAGVRGDGSNNFWMFWGGSDVPNFYARYNTNANIKIDAKFWDIHTFSLDGNVFSVDNTEKPVSGGDISATDNIYIFAGAQNGVSVYPSSMRLYSCQIYDNDTLVRDFVPAKVGDNVGIVDKVNGVFYRNKGQGAFLSGPEKNYVVAKNSVARRIKKAYLGVGSVARPVFTSDIAYWGETFPISWGRPGFRSASTDKYAFFAGGEYAIGDCETYDKSLTYKSIVGLSNFAKFPGAATLDNTVYFAGGFDILSDAPLATVEKYDNSLTKTILPDSLSVARGHIGALGIGNYVVFAGGVRGSNVLYGFNNVDYYDKSGTHFTTQLPNNTYGLSAAKAENIGIFYGEGNKVHAFDSSMTMTSSSDSYENGNIIVKLYSSAASLGEYAIFAGGQRVSYITSFPPQALDIVKVYNASLTKVAQLNLKGASTQFAGVGTGDYALFAGGLNDSDIINTTNCFDTSLTLRELENLSYSRRLLQAAVVGNYALFAGGCDKNNKNTIKNTEVYIF